MQQCAGKIKVKVDVVISLFRGVWSCSYLLVEEAEAKLFNHLFVGFKSFISGL